MSVIPVGLTGGVAEGKTTVLRVLAEQGLRTASADDYAREVLDDPMFWEMASDRLRLNGPLDRRALARLIANDPVKRRTLNDLMHPEVLTRIIEDAPQVVEVPLLIETCLQSLFKRVWVVTCSPEEQSRRLAERYKDPALARQILGTQLSFNVKRCFADKIIRTDGPLSSVVKSVQEIAPEAV